MKNLYNEDGSLRSNVRELVSPKPDNVSVSDRRKQVKAFTSQLSTEEFAEFIRIQRRTQAASYRSRFPEKTKKYRARWRHKNPEKMKNTNKAWTKANFHKVKASLTKYVKARRQKDPLYRFFESIRKQCNRIVKQVGLGKKPTTTLKWIGCTAEELKAHIENLFLEGMTWDNYGKYGWHIDHIRPISSFKPEEWEQISHYTNLQPLWWYDNLSKGNKY
jgi:hypothetical protein